MVLIFLVLFFCFNNHAKAENNSKSNLSSYDLGINENELYRTFNFDLNSGRIISTKKDYKIINVLKRIGLDEKSRLLLYSREKCGSTKFQIGYKEHLLGEKKYVYYLTTDCQGTCSGGLIIQDEQVHKSEKIIVSSSLCRETIGGEFDKRLNRRGKKNIDFENRILKEEFYFTDDGI